MAWPRALRHAATTHRAAEKRFSRDALARLQTAITEGEKTHRGEVRLIVEAALPLRKIRRGMSTRQRAIDLFGTFRVWDTEENNGVLLYVNVADRRVELIADRAAARVVSDAAWQAICEGLQEGFKRGQFEAGTATAIAAIHALLAAHFPAAGARENALSDTPVMI